MSKSDVIEVEGVVTESYPNAMFEVKLPNGHTILAHVSGKMRMMNTALERSDISAEDRARVMKNLRVNNGAYEVLGQPPATQAGAATQPQPQPAAGAATEQTVEQAAEPAPEQGPTPAPAPEAAQAPVQAPVTEDVPPNPMRPQKPAVPPAQ